MTDDRAIDRDAAGWDDAYRGEQPPPWELGRPQPRFVELADEGLFVGSLLDAGCGTGENSLMLAARGLSAYGVDLSVVAIERARHKAAARGLDVPFEAGSVLTMPLPTGVDCALDSGLFHSFTDDDRARYVDVLHGALRPGGVLALMCFSERQGGEWGPRRVTETELRSAFRSGWTVERIEPAVFEINPLPDADFVDAWLGVFRRI